MELENLESLDNHEKDKLENSGKTKNIYSDKYNPDLVIMENNNNLSCGDGKRIEEVKGKGEYSTTITSNIFKYINRMGLKTHFLKQLSSNEMLVERCNMLPIECVFRFVATGSYIKREKSLKGDDAMEDGSILLNPVVEFYFKYDVLDESGNIISDPMIKIGEDGLPKLEDNGKLCLIHPTTGEEFNYTTIFESGTKKEIPFSQIKEDSINFNDISINLFRKTYELGQIIRDFYLEVGIDTFDGKLEFGFNQYNELVLADVVDGDSCRLRIPYVVEGYDGKMYLSGDFIPGELDGIGGHSEMYFEKMEPLPELMGIKRIILAHGLDKDQFRQGGNANDTIDKYAILAEKSLEVLSKIDQEKQIYCETIEGFQKEVEKII